MRSVWQALFYVMFLLPSATFSQSPEQHSIEISLRVPKSEAFNRTMTAMVKEGLVIDRADIASGTITTVPRVSGEWLKIATIYRANILALADTASTVVLSGGYTSKDADRLAGNIASQNGHPTLQDEKPLTSKMRRTLGDAWKVIERVSTALTDGALHK